MVKSLLFDLMVCVLCRAEPLYKFMKDSLVPLNCSKGDALVTSYVVSFEASFVSGLTSFGCFAECLTLVPETARALQTGDSLSIEGLVLTRYCDFSS